MLTDGVGTLIEILGITIGAWPLFSAYSFSTVNPSLALRRGDFLSSSMRGRIAALAMPSGSVGISSSYEL